MHQIDINTGKRKTSSPGIPGWTRPAFVALLIIAGQFLLIGPSLMGTRLLLPLKFLGSPWYYLPAEKSAGMFPENMDQTDLVQYQEPERMFVAREIGAGRFPLWTPHRFGGAPLFPISFSPLWILGYLFMSPVIVAWVQLLTALVAGMGMYLFARRVIKVSYWPAAIVAFCYPLTGSFIVWMGWYLPAVMCWLPWMLTAVDHAIRRPRGVAGPSLGLLTALLLVSGAQDVAGQVLLASGLFAAWCLIDQYGIRRWPGRKFAAGMVVVAAWVLGIAGSAWLMMPFREYIRTGTRFVERAAGLEERPPIGLRELPQVIFPAMYGANSHESVRVSEVLVPESTVGAYAGLVAVLLFLPLAFTSRRHRSLNVCMAGLLFVSLSWALNVPGMVWLLRQPVLNMMSHNRLVFIGSLAILALAAVGLEQVLRGGIRRRWWFELAVVLTILVGGWSVYRAVSLPPLIESGLPGAIAAGNAPLHLKTEEDITRVQRWYREHYAIAAALAILSLAAWYCIRHRGGLPRAVFPVAGVLLCADMLYFAHDRTDQAEPSLYYPRIAAFEEIKQRGPGRIMGYTCFIPNFAQAVGLDDIRGYDGVDPSRMVDLVMAGSLPPAVKTLNALTQTVAPNLEARSDGRVKFTPILSMLGVRYVIFRAKPPEPVRPVIAVDDYWVVENEEVLPRVFVPASAEVVADSAARIERMKSPAFDARKVALLEEAVVLPVEMSGSAAIVREVPTAVTIEADMATEGLLVLADNWDAGWTARAGGKELKVERVNHALRGVVLPAGKHVVEFRFAPPSMRAGAWISLPAVCLLAAWLVAAAVIPAHRARRNVKIAVESTTTDRVPSNVSE